MEFTMKILVVLFLELFSAFVHRGEGQSVHVEAGIGGNATFILPHLTHCHLYDLYDPNNTVIFRMNKYGNSLANWAESRAEYLATSTVINFTIKNINFTDEGQYEFRPETSINDTACSRVYILIIRTPVHGGWSEWSSFGHCSVTCGLGMRNRQRTCTNPRPAYGGNICPGNDNDVTYCSLQTCPVHADWSLWAEGECSVSCGKGTRNRSRVCQIDGQVADANNCTGAAFESASCNVTPCPATPVIAPCLQSSKFIAGPVCDHSKNINYVIDHKMDCYKVLATAPNDPDTFITPYIVGGAVGLVGLIVAIVVVSVVCWKKRKSRYRENNQRRDNSSRGGVQVQRFMSTENPTYAEPDEVDDTYAEIPPDAVAETCNSNFENYPELSIFQSQYQELPNICQRDDGENTYTKIFTNEGNHQTGLIPDVSVASSEAYCDKTNICQSEMNDFNCDLDGGYISPVLGASPDVGVASSVDRHKRTGSGLVKNSDHLNANDYLEPVTKGKY